MLMYFPLRCIIIFFFLGPLPSSKKKGEQSPPWSTGGFVKSVYVDRIDRYEVSRGSRREGFSQDLFVSVRILEVWYFGLDIDIMLHKL